MRDRAAIPRIIRVYVGVVLTMASLAATYAWYVQNSLAVRIELVPLLTFMALGLGLELAGHRLATGNAKGSIAFIVFMATAVTFGPVYGALCTLVSIGGSGVLNGKSWLKTLFNVAQQVLAITIGSLLYFGLGGQITPSALDEVLVPYVAIVVTYFLINSCAVSGVIALSERRRFVDVWVSNTWGLVGYDFVASALGLGIAILYAKWELAGVLSVVVPIVFLRHTYLVNLQLQSTNRELLDLMVKAIEARDPYTSGHSQRVAEMARVIAREMGLGFREVENITTAALLHDVGKIYEEFAPILRKKGKLTEEERILMESHPDRGAELAGTISSLQGPVEKMIRCHHENYDGSGYPSKLPAKDFPVGSRIIMVADTTDAMTTDRPYRRALPFEQVVAELDKFAGSQFDPGIVEIFKRSTMVRRLLATRVLGQVKPGPTHGAQVEDQKVLQLSRR